MVSLLPTMSAMTLIKPALPIPHSSSPSPSPSPSTLLQPSLKTRAKALSKSRESLPIFPARQALLDAIHAYDVVVIVGETGSGKTTQIPQFLMEAKQVRSGKMMAITQPRRVAAISIARRVADEAGVSIGTTVGYSVRFDAKYTQGTTVLKYCTDGMLLREFLNDSLLSRYGVVVVDEAHERSIRTDILLGMLKRIQRIRNTKFQDGQSYELNGTKYDPRALSRIGPLKVIVMSATLDADRFSEFFATGVTKPPKIMYISGRLHPIRVFHTAEPQDDYLDSALITIFQIHQKEPTGDVLVFLSGQDEIEGLTELLNEHAGALPGDKGTLWVLPLYSNLGSQDQYKVFQKTPAGVRKVILATNIAETSITIPGIRYVVDTGMVKVRTFHPKLGLDTLSVMPISKSSARQRAGRAGRESPGTVYRLYTEAGFTSLDESMVPEILRTNLASVILQLKAIGVEDIMDFEFMEPPSRSGLLKGLETLFSLAALNSDGKLTDIGRQMSKLPIEVRLGKVLLSSLKEKFGCTSEIVSIISMLSADNMFVGSGRKEDDEQREGQFMFADGGVMSGGVFGAGYGDHVLLLNVLRGFLEANTKGEKKCKEWCKKHRINYRNMLKGLDIRKQLVDLIIAADMIPSSSRGDLDLSRILNSTYTGDHYETIIKCFLTGYVQNTAIPAPDGWRTVLNNQPVHVYPGSILFGKKWNTGEWALMYDEIVMSSKPYARCVSLVKVEWLREVSRDYLGRV